MPISGSKLCCCSLLVSSSLSLPSSLSLSLPHFACLSPSLGVFHFFCQAQQQSDKRRADFLSNNFLISVASTAPSLGRQRQQQPWHEQQQPWQQQQLACHSASRSSLVALFNFICLALFTHFSRLQLAFCTRGSLVIACRFLEPFILTLTRFGWPKQGVQEEGKRKRGVVQKRSPSPAA